VINRRIESFAVPSSLVGNAESLRLDAGFYSRRVMRALASLEASGMKTRPLGEITERVFIPTRFKRVYVSSEHGIPFLQGSHILQLEPADLKYLSTAAHKDLEPYLIRQGWLLVTRSGTTGRVALVPPEWDGWAASEHVFRIVPSAGDLCPPGYLATYLGSPTGQAQLSAQVYGAVVDELTEAQVRSVRVPVPSTKAQRLIVLEVNGLAMRSIKRRAEAVADARMTRAAVRSKRKQNSAASTT
jgi:hypothetical protein